MKGIDWETFIVIELGRATERERQREAPEMAVENEVTTGAMKAIFTDERYRRLLCDADLVSE